MTDESEEKISDNVIDRYEGVSSVEFMPMPFENYDGEERKYEQYQVLRIATVGLMFVLFIMMIGDGNTISKSLRLSLSHLDYSVDNGGEKGVINILKEGLMELDLDKRPIHSFFWDPNFSSSEKLASMVD